ncbi:MAG: cytosine permease [Cyanothece sp. SIO1E1]|nr:cytosine permease [Cyanothece sp. SIO1E1]
MQTLNPPPTESVQANEDYPLSAVPLSARKPIWSLAPLLMGFALTSTTLLAGGAIAPCFQFWPDTVLLIIVSDFMLGVYCAGLGYIAYQSGLTTVLMARFSFGNLGSRWVDFLLGFTQVSGYAVTTAFIGRSLNQLIEIPSDYQGLIWVGCTYGFCLTAYIGYRAMDWLSRLAVPAMLILVVVSLTLAIRDLGGLAAIQTINTSVGMLGDVETLHATSLHHPASLKMGEAMTVIIATFISGGTQATNWSRFANSGWNAIASTLLAFFVINGLLVLAGVFCFLVYGSQDIVAAMAQQGILTAGLVLLVLNIWTTQDNTIYAFSVAGANMFRTTQRHVLVLGGATVALGLTWAGIYENLVPYLLILGTMIPPVGGIIMADFWLRHRGQFPDLAQPQPAFNGSGLVAYGVAVAIAFFSSRSAWGIAPLNGIIAAVISYYLLVKVGQRLHPLK